MDPSTPPAPGADVTSAAAPAPDPSAPIDVLVVDDDADALRMIQRALGSGATRVRCVATGAQALAAIDAAPPDAVLLDVLMPGMDGFETCRQLRVRHPELPVIFMTGLGETEHVVRGFEVGANDYVTKPVSAPQVLARLQAHTRTARMIRAIRDAVGTEAVPEPAEGVVHPKLTARESEVLLWVARGKTNRDIADILGMSPRTVNKHLEHVFEKLGVETRTAAAAAARRLSLG